MHTVIIDSILLIIIINYVWSSLEKESEVSLSYMLIIIWYII